MRNDRVADVVQPRRDHDVREWVGVGRVVTGQDRDRIPWLVARRRASPPTGSFHDAAQAAGEHTETSIDEQSAYILGEQVLPRPWFDPGVADDGYQPATSRLR
jgi:hypothetical protein